MKKVAILLIGFFLSFLLIGCSEQEAVHTTSSDQVIIRGATSDDTYQVPRIDPSTHALNTISFQHFVMHEGIGYDYTEVTDLAVNNVVDIQITTPDTTEWTHLNLVFNTEAETEWFIYEDVTIALAGTGIAPLNGNRNSLNTSCLAMAVIINDTTVLANVDTIVAGATILQHGISGAGKATGGEGGSRHEVVLRQNEDYSIRFIASLAGYVNYHLGWYEYTNRSP